jgi:hypothetical protein
VQQLWRLKIAQPECKLILLSVLSDRPKSTPTISRLSTLRDLEGYSAGYVSSAPSDGYAKLLPHTDVNLYFKTKLGPAHTMMFNDAMVMGRTSTMTSEGMLRRHTGQQLMLFIELVLFVYNSLLLQVAPRSS